MAKAVMQKDVPYIEELLLNVLHSKEYTVLERMGGLTNHTYKVTMSDGAEYVVRIPGEGTEEIIVRKDEMISTKLACDLGVDAELLYFGENGAKITRYIPNAVTMSADQLKDPKHIEQVAQVFRKIHHCGVDTGVPFEVFDMAASYEKIILEKAVPMFEDYQETKARVLKIKEEIDTHIDVKKVPCHNDALCENWVEGDGRMYLIDWEYAGMNDGIWDLADVSIEAGFENEHDEMLLKMYMGRKPEPMDRKHFLANKVYVDYLWTLWAKARVPYDGQPMEDWAVERYTRLKLFIEQYDKL